MSNSLVATKLFVPRLRDGVVERGRLSELLQRGVSSKLTLISAPAGFGKTTVVTAWLATRGAGPRAVAWLSLDQADNEAATFWTNVIAALQKAAAGIGAPPMQMLQPGQHPVDLVLTSIVNELAAVQSVVDLVLDDYHVINQPDVQTAMVFLLEHLPPNVHVVITTRADPPLPIARMRTQGELVEVRSADLRFTAQESEAYLTQVVGLKLTEKEVAALEERTEGWIAALQLAALSMKGRDDLKAFIEGFSGDDRYVFDYLVEEVLERQSEEVRRFLLDTCFLNRLSGSLCDAVTGRSGSRDTLEALYRANLFIVPLDDRREWYRYHHLFADVLLTQLDEDARRELTVRHRRASDWYEQHGERPEAIQHALAGKDLERAAGLIELAIPGMQSSRREATIRGWVEMLPDELVRNRPVLGIGFVGAQASMGKLDEVEGRLQDIERCLAVIAKAGTSDPVSSPHRVVVVDESQLPLVPGAVERYRAVLAQVRGDVAGMINHAQLALEAAPPDDNLGRASASAILGIAYWSDGYLEAARRSWTESKRGLLRAGHISDALGASIALGDISFAQGHLREAVQVHEQGLKLATEQGSQVLRGTADMHASLSELHRERNDLQAANRHLLKARELGESAGLPQHPYRWRVAMAHLKRDEGDLEGAAALLDEAEHVYASDFFPNVRPVAAMRARVWIAQGRLDDALSWQREAGFSVDDDLVYLRECGHITLARLLLAQQGLGRAGSAERVLPFLNRLLDAAEGGKRNGSVIEISILRALADRHDNIDAALVSLERALALAAPEGYVRLFINEGAPMEALLKLAVKRLIEPAYARALLAAFSPPVERPQVHPDLIEPLSERELDVLRLLATDLGGPEIARALMISPNTTRTHTKNIYDKLGVNSRRSAVRRAAELGLLARSKSH
jgi:LuxR family transcriptional regulator, maltose regulon positive regulatory protein